MPANGIEDIYTCSCGCGKEVTEQEIIWVYEEPYRPECAPEEFNGDNKQKQTIQI